MLELKPIIYQTVIEANRKMTPGDVEKAVSRTAGVDRKRVRLAISDLVSLGELSYTYQYGTSFLERSFDRPVRLSKRIVIKPPQTTYKPRPGEVVVDIAGGAAFGNGAHPTTSLAVRSLDAILSDHRCTQRKVPLKGLDVGTGTGILAITLAKLGVREVVAIDIDPCAISEATRNVSLNGVAEQVTITNTPVEELTTDFSVIVANLYYATLRRLSSTLAEKIEEDGLLVVSGFTKLASENVGKAFTEHGLRLLQEEADHGWACMTLCKRAAHSTC